MPGIIDEYLVQLGTSVDHAGLRRFENALHEMSGFAKQSMSTIAGSVLRAQTEVVGGFAAIGAATIGLIDKVAMADQQYRLFALHMFMSKDAARGLKMAMDALGEPLENLVWDPELRGRATQLMRDQIRMAPGGDFDAQMRKIRDIRFEFTRMEVELKYLGFHVVQDFLQSLGMGPDDLLRKLRMINEWVIANMPELSKKLTAEFLPIWKDVKEALRATSRAIEEAFILFTNLVGLLSGDTSIEGAAFSFDHFAKAVQHASGFMATFAKLIGDSETMLAHMVSGVALLGGGHLAAAGQEFKAGGAAMTTKEWAMLMTGAFGAAFGGPVGALAGAGAAYEGATALEDWMGGRSSVKASVLGDSHVTSLLGSIRGAVPPGTVHAMMAQESAGNPFARSSKGAMGLMQLMPGTAAALGVANPYDAASNVAGGRKYINELMKKYRSLPEALAAYNWGPGHLDKFLAGKLTSMPAETSNYVAGVLGRMGQTGTVQVGSVTIAINPPPGTSPEQIANHVVRKMKDLQGRQAQRNMAEANAWSYSYGQ